MRIIGSTATSPLSANAATRRGASGTFSLGEAQTSHTAGGATAPRALGGIDALIALQGEEDTTERRRKAVRRGSTALDVLDELKMALLSDRPAPAVLDRLKAAATELGESSGDGRLDGILAAIALRVRVEIAKMSRG